MRADFVRSFLVFLEIDGSVFAVITWTTAFVASSPRLSPPNEDGARPWARAPALKVTETNAVASAKKVRRPRTSARYAGNHKPWQAFFLQKSLPTGSLPKGGFRIVRLRFSRQGNNPAQIQAADRASGRDRCKPDFDDGAQILLRQAPRLQCAQTADAESIVHRM